MLTCWIIWKMWCKAAFEGVMPNLIITVDKVKKLHEEYKNTPKVTNPSHKPLNNQEWEASGIGFVKVNCDASWSRQTKMGGIRVVARNSDGRLIGGAN